MKKVLTMAVAVALMMGMASCGGNSDKTSEGGNDTTAQQAQEEAPIMDNWTLGHKFLTENAKNDSVKQTESGLQYLVIKEGNGAKPGPTDVVTVHYTGTLIDGTVFDSSVERGEPATFPLDQVIPGWTEGLQLMSEGSKYRLFIPSELAYGEKGAGDQILPNSTLIFDVELIKVEKKKN